MGLGKNLDIEQGIGSNYQKAYLNILSTNNWILYKLKTTLRPYSITFQQYNVLKILNDNFPQASTAKDISDKMIDQTPDISRLIDRLFKKGWIDRKVSESNRRKLSILITEEGKSLLSTIEPFVNNVLMEHHQVTEEEAGQLSLLLKKWREG